MEGLTIGAGGSGSGTVSTTNALRARQKYIVTSKATEADREEADSMTFVDWMIEIHNNPAGRKQWDLNFHAACSPLLEEMERQVQMAISIFDEICQDKNTLVSNPTVDGAIDLLEKSKNHVKRSTIARNTDIPKTFYNFHSAARVSEVAHVLA